jgi:hypothetical protein
MAKTLKVSEITSFLTALGVNAGEADVLKALETVPRGTAAKAAVSLPEGITQSLETLTAGMSVEQRKALAAILAPRAAKGSAPKVERIPSRIADDSGTVFASGRPGKPGTPVAISSLSEAQRTLILAEDSGVKADYRGAVAGYGANRAPDTAPDTAPAPNGRKPKR